MKVTAEDKITYAKVDKLFESYKKFIEKYCSGDRKILRNEIREYAKLFRQIFNPEVVESELSAEAGLERLNAIIFYLETTTLIPYLLFVERNVNDNAIKSELYGFIESYIMRRLLAKSTTKNYNQLFTERLISNHILSKKDFVDFLKNQADKVNYLPSDTQMKEAIGQYVLTNKQALNTSIRDADWNTKKVGHGIGKEGLEKYAEGIDTFSSFLARTEWNEKAIEDRADFLYEKAVVVWSI